MRNRERKQERKRHMVEKKGKKRKREIERKKRKTKGIRKSCTAM